MPKGIPARGYRISRKTGMPLGGKKVDVATGIIQAMNAEVKEPFIEETEEQILSKLNERFMALEVMTEATAYGKNRAMIVSGPAGLGKSYSVEKIVEQAEENGQQTTFARGFLRPTGLYKMLYENRHSHCVIVFDDIDSVFQDDTCLNLLKAACDSTDTRKISWLSETRMEDEDGERIPRRFEFNGSIIFITNLDFDDMIARGNRLAPHFEALVSRSMYLDLAMKTKKDYLVRIKQVVGMGMLRDSLSHEDEQVLLSFIEENSDKLRELSLRMVKKLSNLMKMTGEWKSLAKITCMKN